MEEEDDIAAEVIRAPTEVARRALAVFAIVCIVFDEPRDEITGWLREKKLYDALTPSEREFIETPSPSEKQSIDASWLSERLVVLCWALYLFEKLPAPDQKCDPVAFMDVLPPFAEIKVSDFIDRATLRPDQELVQQADTILNQHWEARNARLTGAAPRIAVDAEIIRERHHAINWLIGYDGAAWDEVRTDT